MTALLVHPAGLSLTSLFSNAPRTPVPLPSRFPDAPPQTSHHNGATFVFAKGYPVVWEYDARGRRIGELQGGSGVLAVQGFEGGVAVAAGSQISIFTRSGGSGTARWAVSQVFDADNVSALACDGTYLVAAGDVVSAWSLDSGERISLSVDAEPIAFVGNPPTLVLPSASGIACVPLAGGMVRDIPLPIGVVAISVGPRVAIAGPGSDGDIALLDFDSEEVDMLKVGVELAGVAWDGEDVVARSADGRLFVVSAGKVREVNVGETVLGVHLLPQTRPRRSVSDRPRVLGESSVVNQMNQRTVSAPAKSKHASTTTNTTTTTRQPTITEEPVPDTLALETLRAEIANLQLDMLRMGRSLKNEIRAAVAPLVDEIKTSRDTIQRQQAEIERLRRGY